MDIPLEIGKSWLTFGCLCRWSINDAKARVLSCASQLHSSLSSSSCAPPKSQWGEKSCLLFPLKHRCCALSIRLARTLQQRHTCKRWISALQQVAWGVFSLQQQRKAGKIYWNSFCTFLLLWYTRNCILYEVLHGVDGKTN